MIAADGVLNNLQPFANKNSSTQHRQRVMMVMLMGMLGMMMEDVLMGLLGMMPAWALMGLLMATMPILLKSLCGR